MRVYFGSTGQKFVELSEITDLTAHPDRKARDRARAVTGNKKFHIPGSLQEEHEVYQKTLAKSNIMGLFLLITLGLCG